MKDETMDKMVISFLKWGTDNDEFTTVDGAIEWIDNWGVDWDYFEKNMDVPNGPTRAKKEDSKEEDKCPECGSLSYRTADRICLDCQKKIEKEPHQSDVEPTEEECSVCGGGGFRCNGTEECYECGGSGKKQEEEPEEEKRTSCKGCKWLHHLRKEPCDSCFHYDRWEPKEEKDKEVK